MTNYSLPPLPPLEALETLDIAQAQERLDELIYRAVHAHKPTVIVGSGGEWAVLMSEADYNAFQRLRREAEDRESKAQAAGKHGDTKTRRLIIDIDDDLLAAAQEALGTTTCEETVNEALRLIAEHHQEQRAEDAHLRQETGKDIAPPQ
jgi:prevent-host-death family protein